MAFPLCKCETCHCSHSIEHVWLDESLVCWACSKGLHSGALKPHEPPHQHAGWHCCTQRRSEMAGRILLDECVLVPLYDRADLTNPMTRLFCVTHGKSDSPDHAVDKGHLATLD